MRGSMLSMKHQQQRWKLELCNSGKCLPHHIQQSSTDTSATTIPNPRKCAQTRASHPEASPDTHTWGYQSATDDSRSPGVATWLQLTALAAYCNHIPMANNILVPGFSKENIWRTRDFPTKHWLFHIRSINWMIPDNFQGNLHSVNFDSFSLNPSETDAGCR